MIAEIVALLKADAQIATTATGGVYNHDIRRAGWESTPGAFDQWGEIKPLLMVDDNGSISEPFGSFVDAGSIYIWVIGPRTTNGRQAVTNLIDRTRWLLTRWQEARTGTTLFYAGRLGQRVDNDGVLDRLTWKAAGVVPVARY